MKVNDFIRLKSGSPFCSSVKRPEIVGIQIVRVSSSLGRSKRRCFVLWFVSSRLDLAILESNRSDFL